jgi:lysophospholipid acyltransferase (LPLAT)-like uncharacterized protein
VDGEETKDTQPPGRARRAAWALAAWPLGAALWLWTALGERTSRVRVEGPGAAHSGPALYVNWHRYLPYLCVHHGHHQRWLMVSRAPALQPIARWCRLLGVRTIRGGSGGGGQEAAAHLVARLRAGDSAFLAVDGPAGPPLRAKRGCVDIALAAGVPLIAVAYRCTRGRFNARRWDSWLMFRPFDTITVRYGAPLRLRPEWSVPEALERVGRALADVSDMRPEATRTKK